MSVRLVKHWAEDSLQHTLIDDLESVVWVLLYEILRSSGNSITKDETQLLDRLTDSDSINLGSLKADIALQFAYQFIADAAVWSQPVRALAPLLTPLFKLTIDAQTALKTCFVGLRDDACEAGSDTYWQQLDKLCEEFAVKYLDVVIDFTEKL